MLIAMWNYMGWDNASTIATEVERPQRTYPRAMLAGGGSGFAHLHFAGDRDVVHRDARRAHSARGSWAEFAGMLGGQGLRVALVLGGMMSAFGMFNALVMSYSRLPLAMAQDGMLPAVFGKTTRAPARLTLPF